MDIHRFPDAAALTSQRLADAFPHAREDILRRLALAGRLQAFGRDDVIIRQGSDEALTLVLDGFVGLRRTTDEGREFVARVVSNGELAGVMALASRRAVVDTVSMSACRVLTWRAAEVRPLVSADAGFAADALQHALLTLGDIVEGLDGFLYRDAIKRVVRVLHRYRDLLFGDRQVLTRRQLPALVGTSREMTGRVLRILEQRRLVERRGRDELALRDPAWLEAAWASDSQIERPLRRSSR